MDETWGGSPAKRGDRARLRGCFVNSALAWGGALFDAWCHGPKGQATVARAEGSSTGA